MTSKGKGNGGKRNESPLPKTSSSVMHTRTDCATSFAPRELRERASKSPSSSDEHLKIRSSERLTSAPRLVCPTGKSVDHFCA